MIKESVLKQPVTYIKGIGPRKALKLNKMGIYCVEDFFYSYPRDYEDRRHIKKINQVEAGEQALILTKVIAIRKNRARNKRKQILRLLVEDETSRMEILFFNAFYYLKSFEKGKAYYFFGQVSISNGKKQMIHPDFSELENDKMKGLIPIYPLTEGFSQNERRKIQHKVMPYIAEIDEYLPIEVVKRNRLCDIQYAIQGIHFPESPRATKVAKFRLIFEELFFLQMGLLMIKNKLQEEAQGIVFSSNMSVNDFVNQLPFALTQAQQKVINEVIEDMEKTKVMNRLIQGDVGSGKTVVAAVAIYKALICNYQAVLMAPTEILARQHYETLKDLFQDHSYGIECLSSSTPQKERKRILKDLEIGKIDLIIGTHAVIQQKVHFFNLGLVITDEQHRFGVGQRTALANKGAYPDVLVMTATPIPRTLALILYGDLDISIIDEMPPGRKAIKTFCANEESREFNRKEVYRYVLKEIEKGRQAYIVAPLIEDSESIDVKSVESLHKELKSYFKHYRVSILHGQIKQQEKNAIMEDFVKGHIHVLVSTVVIEVGINVPNASVMVIENAERFGLAQLHQLRGRVGRGLHQSYCFLIQSGHGEVAKQRAEIMEKSNDGFVIAEKDLNIRGPGDFFGTKQHGLPELKIANLFQHIKILKLVQKEVKMIIQDDPDLKKNKNKKVMFKIHERFENLGNVHL